MLWAFGIFPSISGEKLLTRRSMDYSETRTLLLKIISNVEFLNIVFFISERSRNYISYSFMYCGVGVSVSRRYCKTEICRIGNSK